jgi:hypothetical protein
MAYMRAHEYRVRDDGLRLGSSGGGVIVVRVVPLSRECAGRSEGGGPVGQRGSTRLQCGRSAEHKAANASHIGIA